MIRTRLQFGLGSLLWLILLAAVLLGWHKERTRLRQDFSRMQAEVRALQLRATYDKKLFKAIEQRSMEAESKLMRYREIEKNERDRIREESRLRWQRESALLSGDRQK